MAAKCKLRNVSTTYQAKFQTQDGNVTVTNFKKGLWQVHERGFEPFMVRSKKHAFDEACGISEARHRRQPRKRSR
jgi:hypothetical protein